MPIHASSLASQMNANATLMRRLNRSSVLDLLRRHSPIAPSEISRRLHISLPTVMRILEALISENLARYSGDIQVSGGRPRTLVEFDPISHAVVGLDLGGTKMYGTVADLSGTIQAEIYRPSSPGNPEKNIDIVCELITDLLAQPRPEGQSVLGIGVGAPGVTIFEQGLITWAPSLGWRNLPLRDLLNARFNMPVLIENDVNLAALGEYGFGSAKGASSLVCLAVGTGIGSGIVIDRKIYRGFRQSAGEVGYLPPGVEYLGRRYDHFGALESLASGTGVETRARILSQSAGIPMDKYWNGNGLTSEKVFEAARQGESWAQHIVDETVDYLALGIAAISAIIDPEVIVLGGGVARSADILIDPILKRLDGVLAAPVHIIPSKLGYRAAVMGAIMIVLDATTEYVMVK